MQLLGVPGHDNVLHLIDFLDDATNYYVVTEFLAGGELFDVLRLTTDNEELTRKFMWDAVLGESSRGV